jgi:chromosome segregation protein
MRLSKVKLAGFKSFVDPTTLHLSGTIVGVVGPNGCGKSNVIDAVRWVMGESSARHLRGESMADVIFNGSSTRRPVGQAFVELVFDNADGGLGGPYAQYAEIAIRRQVTRDGESLYFLNGTRCRRRDITDLFLGTGLGPRSYSIIEQGTISRVIEARPEDLRLFIEEAAGISRYKERRRETEARMRDTQDNLARLSDLRTELERQLEHLGRQAKNAERYRQLKQRERELRAELLALRWRALRETADAEARAVAAAETAHAAALARQRQAEAAGEREREAHARASEGLGEVQGRFYAASAEVARLDQAIEHARQRQADLRAEIDRTGRLLEDARGQRSADEAELARLAEASAREEPAHRQALAGEAEARGELDAAEGAMQAWQSDWDGLNARLLAPARAVDVERTRIHHLDQQLTRLADRARRLEAERSELASAPIEAELAGLGEALAGLEAERAALDAGLAEGRARVGAQRERNRATEAALAEARSRRQAALGRRASLQALQEEALGKRSAAVADWLAGRGLADRPRLAEALQVEAGWERAVEGVLGHHLQAVCVAGFAGLAAGLGEPPAGAVSLFDTTAGGGGREGAPAAALAAKVEAPWPLGPLLGGVRVAGSWEEAEGLRPGLGDQESLVTPDGVWTGRSWLRLDRTSEGTAGVLEREQALRALAGELDALAVELTGLEGRQREGLAALQGLEAEQAGRQARQAGLQREHAGLEARAGQHRARLEQVERRARGVADELADLGRQREAAQADLVQARDRLEAELATLAALEAERERLLAEREACRARLDAARQAWHQARERTQAVALTLEGVRARREGIERSARRVGDQIEDLESRRAGLAAALAEAAAPLERAGPEREQALAAQRAVEEDLRRARREVEAVEERLRALEQERRAGEEAADAERSRLESARLAREATRVRLQELDQDLRDLGARVEDLLPALGDGARAAEWEQELEAIERRVARLGPINLAAIDEFAEQSERKRYLDSQHADLVDALATLEGAIRRMDRETRERFKATFDRLNAGFRDTFPRLLGGGEAALELTGEDLLETGVTVTARPPGKRNSSIHLLSGGEKALTAIALVFAIFDLNPAPFCLLDEVDAPLDDNNVGRFCGLLRAMSQRVQFILVTHNKTTMELADHLVGVTMHEPGASRLVHVDVDEAVGLAAV